MNKALKRAGIEEKYFDTNEIKLNYVAGPPNGTPIVFIPGQGVTWEEYSLLLPKLPLEKPAEESQEILYWVREFLKNSL